MKKPNHLRQLRAFVAIAVAISGAPVTAADSPVTQADRSRNIAQGTGKILSQAIVELNAEEYDEATATLAPLLAPERLAELSPFEQSRVFQPRSVCT